MIEDKPTRRPSFWKRFWERFTATLVIVFGRWNWTAPPWLAAGTRVVQTGASRVSSTNPKKLWGIAGALVAVLGLGLGGYAWYLKHPPPNKFTVWVDAPPLTRLEEPVTIYPARVHFSGSAARLEQVGREKPITQGISLKPAIDGQWFWDNDHELVFVPKQDWAVGQKYRVQMDRSLFPSHVRIEEYSVEFSSAPFTAEIRSAEFYQDPKKAKSKKIVSTVVFSHPVDMKDFEKRAGMAMGDFKSKQKFSTSFNKLKTEAYLHSEDLTIPAKDTTFYVTVDSGARAERGGPTTKDKSERTVTVPGMYTYFRVNGVTPTLVRNEQYEPEQVLVLDVTAEAEMKEIEKNLTVWLLPENKPETPGMPAHKKHQWMDPSEVAPEVLKLASKVALTTIPTEHEADKLFSFKYEAPVGRHLYVQLKKGTRSFGEYILAEPFDAVVKVPRFPKELSVMHEGSILSLSGEKKLSILSRDVPAVRFEVGRVLASEVNHLVSQTGGTFGRPDFTNYAFNADNISEFSTEVRKLKRLGPGKTQYASFDFAPYLQKGGKRGLFFFKVESWDMEKKKPTGKADQRFILVTDLGVLVKDAKDGTHDVFVQSIFSGRPVGGATVEVLGKNGVPILTRNTGPEGHASFPKLDDFMREKQPVAWVVRRENDISFLPFERYDRRLNFSRFDTGGVVSTTESDRLNAYLFSDRGLYRPGDEFHVGFIVKPPNWEQSVAGVPLEISVTDPRGVEIHKKKISLTATGFDELSYQTEDSSPTGSYQVSLYVVKDGRRAGLLGETSVRVEEFLPDRLRITSRFSRERFEGWVSPDDLKATVSLANLFGTPAEDRKVVATISLSPAYPAFRPYKDFTFFDPAKTEKSFSENLETKQTDSKGEAEFTLGLEKFEKSTYRLKFIAEGFEAEGGRAVTTESAVLVSPLPYLVGYKADGPLGYLKKATEHSIEVIAVNPELKKIAVKGLTAQLMEIKWVSVLTKQPDGTFRYQSVKKETTVSKTPFAIAEKGATYPLATDKPGTFALLLRDEADTILTRVDYGIIGEANLTRSLDKNAELQVTLGAADYSPGEEIELEIRAPYTGAGLITIERDKVYAFKWFETTTTSSVHRIKLPDNLEGNGYVNVAFVRGLSSKEVYMSPLSYGVAPFSVSRARRVNKVDLTIPELARPGEKFPIKYQASKPGSLVIFAVDEGILQVAKYKTPDPVGHFFKKKALEVTTSQILDLILPEFSVANKSAAGGDGEGGEIGKNLNPFKRKRDKPVVYWSGILQTDGKPGEVSWDVPDSFNGQLSVFAVVVATDAIGVDRKKAFIRGPFVISPNVPTFVAPGDEFEVSAGISNQLEGSGAKAKIKMELDAGKALTVTDGAQEIEIPEGREKAVRFKVKASAILGSVPLTFKASAGGKSAKITVELSLRPAIPFRTSFTAGNIKDDKVEVPTPRRMYSEFRKNEVSLSTVPLTLARGLLTYLNHFPYGCTEQIVSRAFPALVLRSRPEFGYEGKKVEQTLAETLRILRARQNSEGGFGFWAANSHVSPFQTAYATHFLMDAVEKGYTVPKEVIARALQYLEGIVQSDVEGGLFVWRDKAYALYLLTRGGKVTTAYLTPMRKKLDEKFGKNWKTDLTGQFLAATYRLLQQESEGNALMKVSKLGDPQEVDYTYFYDGLLRDSMWLYLSSRHFPERLKDLTGDDLQHIVKPIVGGSYNTITSSVSILGLDAYATVVGTVNPSNAVLTELLAAGKEKPLPISSGLFPKVDFSDAAEKIRVVNKNPNLLFYQVLQAGFETLLPTKAMMERLEVQREYRLAGKVTDSATIGAQVEVRVRVRSTEQAGASHVAIVDLLPGGFEVVLDSIRPVTPPESVDGPGNGNGIGEPPPEEMGDEGEGEGGEGAAVRAPSRNAWAAAPGAAPAAAPEPQRQPAAAALATFYPEYVDIREDRVVLYGRAQNEAQEFVYTIRATNRGTFVTPPVFGESMYDRRIQAMGVAGKMNVKGD